MSSRLLSWPSLVHDLVTMPNSTLLVLCPSAYRDQVYNGKQTGQEYKIGMESGAHSADDSCSNKSKGHQMTPLFCQEWGRKRKERIGMIRLFLSKMKFEVKKENLFNMSKRVICYPLLDYIFSECIKCTRDCAGHREKWVNCQAGPSQDL